MKNKLLAKSHGIWVFWTPEDGYLPDFRKIKNMSVWEIMALETDSQLISIYVNLLVAAKT